MAPKICPRAAAEAAAVDGVGRRCSKCRAASGGSGCANALRGCNGGPSPAAWRSRTASHWSAGAAGGGVFGGQEITFGDIALQRPREVHAVRLPTSGTRSPRSPSCRASAAIAASSGAASGGSCSRTRPAGGSRRSRPSRCPAVLDLRSGGCPDDPFLARSVGAHRPGHRRQRSRAPPETPQGRFSPMIGVELLRERLESAPSTQPRRLDGLGVTPYTGEVWRRSRRRPRSRPRERARATEGGSLRTGGRGSVVILNAFEQCHGAADSMH